MLMPLILMLFRRTVHEFYEKKEYPTLDKLLQVLKEKILFKGGRI